MAEERFSFRWGIPWLDGGYMMVPNFFFSHYVELGVTRPEFLFVLHLARYRFESQRGVSRPSLQAVAKEMGYGRRQVQRMVGSLESKGWLVVTECPGKPSEYDFEGLARALLRREGDRDKNVTRDIHDTPTLDTHVQGTLDTHDTRRRRIEEEESEEKRSVTDVHDEREEEAVAVLMENCYSERVAEEMVGEYGPERIIEVVIEAARGGHLEEQGDWIRRELARGEEADQ